MNNPLAIRPPSLGRLHCNLFRPGLHALRCFIMLGATMMLVGCVGTFKEVHSLGGGPPPKERPSALVVADITIADTRLSEPEQKVMQHAFRLGVEKWCAEHKVANVLADLPAGASQDTLVLKGVVTEVEKGSAAARFWVGMGAGQQRAVGEFTVHAADGTRLTAFKVRRSYLGGNGIGGWDMMKLEDLVDQLGQLAAETLDKWLRGQKIE